MSAELWFIERCLNMPVGSSENYPPLGVTLHRWETPLCQQWWALWDQPLRKLPLGLELNGALELRAFLAGNNNVGTPILLETHVIPGF